MTVSWAPRDSSTLLGMTGEHCHTRFQRLLIRREKSRRVDRGDNCQSGAAILIRWRLQRRGSGAGEADAERR